MIIYPSLEDISLYLGGSDLTANGVQYATEIPTTALDTDVTILSKTVGYIGKADLIWIYFNLECAFKANASGTADVKWKAQARNKNGTWIDLFDWVTYANIGIAYLDKVMKGYALLQESFNEVPFDFRILYQCNELNEGRAKLKNTSFVRLVYKRRF